MRDIKPDQTSTTHQLYSTHQAFKRSRYLKIASIGLATMQNSIQLYFSIFYQTECGCACCKIMIALQVQPIEFLKRGTKNSGLDLWLEHLSVGSDQTFITKQTFTFLRMSTDSTFSISSGISVEIVTIELHIWWHSYSQEEMAGQRIPRNYWPNYSDGVWNVKQTNYKISVGIIQVQVVIQGL